jgi:aminoglycoside phosphotransferase (APT) family kinase protein
LTPGVLRGKDPNLDARTGESALKRQSPEERVARIEAFIGHETGKPTRVTGLRRLAGGSSRQVWSFDATLGEGPDRETLPLVFRLDPTGGTRESTPAGQGGGFGGEFRLLEASYRGGVPVPRIYWRCEEPEVLGGPFYVMERLEGETIPRRILRSEDLSAARELLPEQLGRALARIHRVDIEREGLGWLPGPRPGSSAPEAQISQLRSGIDLGSRPVPVLELVYRWLEKNVPPERDRTLVHGDFRMGNVIVGPEGLRAILDWELAHIGDPHEDVAWICTKTWRFGEVDRPFGGLGPAEPFYRAYEEESGRKLDSDALRYWELLSSAKCAVVWIVQLHAYLSGVIPSVEQAVIGRRLAETEWDLLELIQRR